MAITFDSLPNTKPSDSITKGTYYATIEIAEMRQPKDPTKPQYLNMLLALKDKNGKTVGKIYDILTESDKTILQYKLAQFIKALKLETTLNIFELADLCKVVKNKELIVDVAPEKKDNQETGRTTVDIFSGSIYYPLSEAKNIFKTSPTDLEIIDEDDAADASPVHDDTNTDDIF